MKKILVAALAVLFGIPILVFVLIQLVPYGRNHNNPPVVAEPQWDSPQTRQLVKDHCFQCHSNETSWPWYTNIAPGSWLIARDVEEGRAQFNFSDWNNHPAELDELIENIQSGEMPPVQYWIFHPESRLTEQQKQDLIHGLEASIQ